MVIVKGGVSRPERNHVFNPDHSEQLPRNDYYFLLGAFLLYTGSWYIQSLTSIFIIYQKIIENRFPKFFALKLPVIALNHDVPNHGLFLALTSIRN